MNLFFPQLQCALVVRKTRPAGAQYVTSWGDNTVYLIPAKSRPRGCKVAEKLLGGWNYPSGEAVGLVYARSFSALTRFCEAEGGDKLVRTKRLPNGLFVNLVKTRTKLFMSVGITPVLAEAELAEDDAE